MWNVRDLCTFCSFVGTLVAGHRACYDFLYALLIPSGLFKLKKLRVIVILENLRSVKIEVQRCRPFRVVFSDSSTPNSTSSTPVSSSQSSLSSASSSNSASCQSVRAYVRAYSRKVKPIMLTVVSTVAGLIPFLTDGPTEVFWFSFAVGTIGGICFPFWHLSSYSRSLSCLLYAVRKPS